MIARACRFLLCSLLLTGHAAVGAAAPLPLLTDYTHTAWTEMDGAPTEVTKFAQGPDGWLWIATPTGLFRFDGMRFGRADKVYGNALDSSNIMGLTATPDGALWVGYRVGGVSVFRKDGARTYKEADGLRPVGVVHIEPAPDGSVWVAMRDGVAVLEAGAQRFRYLGAEAGLPSLGVFQILFALDGTTWVGTTSGAYFRRPGASRFSHAWPRKTLVWLDEAPDGTLWGNDFQRGYYRVRTAPPADGAPAAPELEAVGMRHDRNGTMWLIHVDGIERKVALDGPSLPEQRLSGSNGISGPMIGATFVDREGNLWIGTSRGIDRLRPSRVRTMPALKQMEYPALVTGPAGDVWVGDYAGDLWSYGPAGRRRREVEGALTASYTAPDGVLWLGGLEAVQRRGLDGSLTATPFPADVKGLRAQALLQDGEGGLWASFSASKSVYRLAGGQWTRSGGLQGIPELLTTCMARDGGGNVWMGHVQGRVTIVAGGAVRSLEPGPGLQLGTILHLYPEGKAMWLGAEGGVALYRDGRFAALRGVRAGLRGQQFRGVSGVVRLPGGDLWLNGAEGLFHIAAAELEAWLKDPDTLVAYERFNAHDGIHGRAPQLRPLPSLLRSRDGALWFATTGSVGTVDPARIARNPLPPPVQVVSVAANGTRYAVPPGGALGLPEGTRTMQIDFAALSLSVPERVRVRYRLVGLDYGWQEPVESRQAQYTNLAPGKYRFELIAANEDNVWNTKGEALEIDIPPTFVQSGWFKLLLAAIALLLLYMAYALRIRYLTRLMRDRLHQRLAERTRIARTLHDTLLQSMHSLLITFDAHSRQLEEGTQERKRLDRTLNLAEQLLVEGRDQIMDLRASASPEMLELTLAQLGKTLAEHRPHVFDMTVRGGPKQLRQDAQEEIYAIAREALFNASRYADATRIELTLEHGADALLVRVRDNGRGLDESVAAAGHRPGHWGLQGMRERANSIDATLEIASAPGAGTEITLTVPARRAY